MEKRHQILLTIDGIVNIVLGIIILLIPAGVDKWLGIPLADTHFYSTILGGVIFGIGIALLIERYGFTRNIHGLGLGGAITINFCGAGVLLYWLLFIPLDIPLRGIVLLWSIAILVFVIGIAELFSKF